MSFRQGGPARRVELPSVVEPLDVIAHCRQIILVAKQELPIRVVHVLQAKTTSGGKLLSAGRRIVTRNVTEGIAVVTIELSLRVGSLIEQPLRVSLADASGYHELANHR